MGTRLNGFLSILGGWFIGTIGYAMYQRPHIDWQSLVETWRLIGTEAVRLYNDPFAVAGGIVALMGLVIIIAGFRMLILGPRTRRLNRSWENDAN